VAWYVENKEWWSAILAGEHRKFYDAWYGQRLAAVARPIRPA